MMPEILHQGKFLRLCKSGRWEFAESCVAHGVVGILAETTAGEYVLIEQVRPPVDGPVIELPGGLVGDDGALEPALEAAQRELLEEAGWGKGQWTSLGIGATSPGLTSEKVELFHARGVEKLAAGGGVHGEEIRTHLIAISEMRAWLRARREEGAMVDFRVLSALWLAESLV